jgi:hypothetical protein
MRAKSMVLLFNNGVTLLENDIFKNCFSIDEGKP